MVRCVGLSYDEELLLVWGQDWSQGPRKGWLPGFVWEGGETIEMGLRASKDSQGSGGCGSSQVLCVKGPQGAGVVGCW